MTSTTKSAVSDYEHLKYRFNNENQLWLDEDEEILPLKSREKQKDSQSERQRPSNSNQNNAFSSSSRDILENGFASIERIPVPSAWSPGMIVKPHPSIFITPEKAKNGPEKYNILEPQDLNKVPVPTAWSPHPELKPSVFITPEKTSDPTPSSFTATSFTYKPAIQTTDTSKSKEKLSVRFDLPSISSGDELLESSAISDSGSPITIKGKDFIEGQGESIRSSCPSKAYNPMVYSDDSVLDDSIPGDKGMGASGTVSLSTSANLVEKLNQLLISSKIHEDDVIPVQSTASPSASQKHSQNTMTDSSVLKSKGHVSSQQSSMLKNTSSFNANNNNKQSSSFTGNKSSRKPSHSSQTRQTKSGPHHLSSSVSPYYPPNSGTCVVREAKHPMVSTDYSYPFQNVDDNQKHEHVFSRPEFNSTLKVRSELDSLCDQDVDVQKAVGVKLSKSNTKQTEIQEKAAVFTNQVFEQFTNLVDLEPAVGRLCDRVVRMRTSKATSQKKGSKHQKKTSGLKEPDLMEFYHADLQKESPDLGLLGVNPVVPDLMGALHDQAFDCYRHNRVWNGLKDF